MPIKGTGHRKTKKHAGLNQENYERHKGIKQVTLADLKKEV